MQLRPQPEQRDSGRRRGNLYGSDDRGFGMRLDQREQRELDLGDSRRLRERQRRHNIHRGRKYGCDGSQCGYHQRRGCSFFIASGGRASIHAQSGFGELQFGGDNRICHRDVILDDRFLDGGEQRKLDHDHERSLEDGQQERRLRGRGEYNAEHAHRDAYYRGPDLRDHAGRRSVL